MWGIDSHDRAFLSPSATTQTGEKASVVEKISAEDFGYAENEMAAGNCLEDLLTEPSPEFHLAVILHPLIDLQDNRVLACPSKMFYNPASASTHLYERKYNAHKFLV